MNAIKFVSAIILVLIFIPKQFPARGRKHLLDSKMLYADNHYDITPWGSAPGNSYEFVSMFSLR
jgi:hypothetical protein